MKETWEWVVTIGVVLLIATAVCIVDSKGRMEKENKCQQGRIRAFTPEFFTWEGIVGLTQRKQYQPECL